MIHSFFVRPVGLTIEIGNRTYSSRLDLHNYRHAVIGLRLLQFLQQSRLGHILYIDIDSRKNIFSRNRFTEYLLHPLPLNPLPNPFSVYSTQQRVARQLYPRRTASPLAIHHTGIYTAYRTGSQQSERSFPAQ